MAVKQKKERRFDPVMLILGIILLIHTVSFLVPLGWSIITSLKDEIEFKVNLFGLPEEWLFSNYPTVLSKFFVKVESGLAFREVYVAEMLFNSIMYAVGCALVQTTTQYVMAYISSRFRYKFGAIIYGIVLFALAFPLVGGNAAGMALAIKLHLRDRFLGIYLMKAYFLGMYFLVFYAQLRAFPKDFDEAAEIDGASKFTVMWKIIFPMTATTFFTIALLLFIAYWNDYTTPMLYMPNKPTLSYGLYLFSKTNDSGISNTPTQLAACVMLMVPVLVLFMIFHKRLIGNVSLGGLKE